MRIYRNFIIKFILSIIGNLYNQLQLFFHTKIFFLLKKKFIKDYYRNTLYSKNFNSEVILNKLYPPKIFIFRNVKLQKDLVKNIKKFEKKFNAHSVYNEKIFQSEHNLQKNKKFKYIKINLEKLLNKELKKFYKFKSIKIRIIHMWFVISKNNSKIRPHYHPSGHLSGVYYPENKDNNKFSFLNIHNPWIELLVLDFNKNSFKQKFVNNKKYVFKPKKNDLIIFDSYLFHSVSVINNFDHKERISFAWDAKFIN